MSTPASDAARPFWRPEPGTKYEFRAGRFDPASMRPYSIDRLSLAEVPAGSTVLEIGCATGFMSEYLRGEKGCRVIGVDLDPEQVKVAATRSDVAICGDLEDPETLARVRKAASALGGIDVVLASAILEHLQYPDRMLEVLRGLLKPEGRIIVTLPNVAHWSLRFALLRGRWEYDDYGLLDRTHLRFFSYPAARSLIESAGFEIVRWDIDPVSGFPLLGGFLTRSPSVDRRLAPKLQALYRKFPNFYGHQLMFVARPVNGGPP